MPEIKNQELMKILQEVALMKILQENCNYNSIKSKKKMCTQIDTIYKN